MNIVDLIITRALLPMVFAIAFAPLLPGIINRVKAWFAGRRGQPVFQTYYDIIKLLRKSAVFSKTTSEFFRLGPLVAMVSTMFAVFIVPLGPITSVLAFQGDIFLIVFLLALGRFATITAALDTGSSFEGMGASREAFFSSLVEPGIFLCMLGLAKLTGSFSMKSILYGLSAEHWFTHAPTLCLIVVALFIIMLAENARIPVDDPNTHLELTMIHEVMVLDHSGVEFGVITFTSALKLFLGSAIISQVLLPVHTGNTLADVAVRLCAMCVVMGIVGVVESTMARLRMFIVPQMLVGAIILAATGILMLWI